MKSRVERNELGFYQIVDKPTKEQLIKYYEEKYYQDELHYARHYSDQELTYITNQIKRRFALVNELLPNLNPKCSPDGTPRSRRLLDVGCGEGWALQFFQDRGWKVLGLDYSLHGVMTHNPDLLNSVTSGDVESSIKCLIEQNEKFDVIWLDNVLEHTLCPVSVMRMCRELAIPTSQLIVEVPNDFSAIQEYLLESGEIDKPYWIIEPDHISYFSKESLEALGVSTGWQVKRTFSDFPIELFLFNERSNYARTPSAGKACHLARIKIENLLHDMNSEKLTELYQLLAEMGLGRSLICYFHVRN